MNVIKSLKNRAHYCLSFVNPDFLTLLENRRVKKSLRPEGALRAGYQWLCQAQDAFQDGGVARSYSLVHNPNFGLRGWIPSYPETTGYIIPTVFEYAEKTRDQEAFKRALRMADWECDIQMANGAIQGGYIGQKASPAVFNTGQVIFGWIDAYVQTGKQRYVNCAVKAGHFLVACQDEDGAWRRNLSDFTTDKIPFYSYNTRTAWALYLLYEQTGEKIFAERAIKNIEFTLKHQRDNGCFENNCLSNFQEPLLHTIAYCIRGILEVGICLNNEKYLTTAQKAAEQLLARMKNDGKLAGRFDLNWNEAVSWSCLTGQAQTAVIWGKLFQLTNDAAYLEGLERVNRYLMDKQILSVRNERLHGGIPGSDPISGGYGRFEILSWAVKFFMDALMLEEKIKAGGLSGPVSPDSPKLADQRALN
jgi:uncharacterized protein YyaL (SSP411 family)